MTDLYHQVKSDKYGRAFIITLLLFISLAIIYAITVYQSNKAYKTEILSKKDTVYLAKYASVSETAQSAQPAQNNIINIVDVSNDTEEDYSVHFTKGELTAEGEELILKKMDAFQRKNHITSKFVAIGEYLTISEQSNIDRLKSLLKAKGYVTYVTVHVLASIPNGISIGKTAISENEYQMVLYVGM